MSSRYRGVSTPGWATQQKRNPTLMAAMRNAKAGGGGKAPPPLDTAVVSPKNSALASPKNRTPRGKTTPRKDVFFVAEVEVVKVGRSGSNNSGNSGAPELSNAPKDMTRSRSPGSPKSVFLQQSSRQESALDRAGSPTVTGGTRTPRSPPRTPKAPPLPEQKRSSSLMRGRGEATQSGGTAKEPAPGGGGGGRLSARGTRPAGTSAERSKSAGPAEAAKAVKQAPWSIAGAEAAQTSSARNGKWLSWKRFLDDKALGAHYRVVCMPLPSARAVPNAEQREYDSFQTEFLRERRPSEPQVMTPRSVPKVPAITAFPDRSLRLREGQGSLRALSYDKAAPGEAAEVHMPCGCAVCDPNNWRAAGQPSHEVHYNKTSRCGKAHQPSRSLWQESSTHVLNSESMRPSLVFDPSDKPELEEQFTKLLGRKGKTASSSSLTTRTPTDDDVAVAGGYDQERDSFTTFRRSRRAFPPHRNEERVRSGVALIINPHPDDPPPPTQICASLRGSGIYKETFTDETERLILEQNQANLRFASSRIPPRGRSQPAYRGEDYAGRPSGAPYHQQHEATCLFSREDRSPSVGPLGSRSSSRELRSFRANPGNASLGVSQLMNSETMEKSFAHEKAWRLQTDKAFADMCRKTEDVVQAQRSFADLHRVAIGQSSSANVKAQLVWEH